MQHFFHEGSWHFCLWKCLSGPLVVDGINAKSTALGHNMDSLEGERRLLAGATLRFSTLTEHISASLCRSECVHVFSNRLLGTLS